MPMLPEPEPRHRARHRAKSHPLRLLTAGATFGALAVSVSLAAPAFEPGQSGALSPALRSGSATSRFLGGLGFTPQPAQAGADGIVAPGRPAPAGVSLGAPQNVAQWVRLLTLPGPAVSAPPVMAGQPTHLWRLRMPGQRHRIPDDHGPVILADPGPSPVTASPVPGQPPARPVRPPVTSPRPTPNPRPTRHTPEPSTTTEPAPVETTPASEPTTSTPEPTWTPRRRHHRHHRPPVAIYLPTPDPSCTDTPEPDPTTSTPEPTTSTPPEGITTGEPTPTGDPTTDTPTETPTGETPTPEATTSTAADVAVTQTATTSGPVPTDLPTP